MKRENPGGSEFSPRATKVCVAGGSEISQRKQIASTENIFLSFSYFKDTSRAEFAPGNCLRSRVSLVKQKIDSNLCKHSLARVQPSARISRRKGFRKRSENTLKVKNGMAKV